MRRISQAAPLLLCFACSSSTTVTPAPQTDAGPAYEASTDPPDGGYSLPTGYTLVPFLDTTVTHTYAKADQVIDATKSYVAVLDTDQGRMVMQLYAADTPITVNSFVFLALHHFYDGLAFHRVIDGFMAQGGDPLSLKAAQSKWGTGGPGYTFADEILPKYTFDSAGVVGMANSGPNTNGSQFFIVFSAQPGLDQQHAYTIWAKVIDGLDVLPKIVRGDPGSTNMAFKPPATRILDVAIGVK